MRDGMPFTLAWKTQVNAILATPPNDPVNLNRANVEFPQSLFYDRNLASELLFEINFGLRLARIAQSRDEVRLRKVDAASHLQLVCVDGEPVNSLNELNALGQP